MSDEFIETGWKFDSTIQGDPSVDLGPVSLTGSAGVIHLVSDFNEKVELSFISIGAGVGKSLGEVNMTVATREMPSVGVVFANPVFRDSLSVEDFCGACLIQSYSASAFVGGSAAGIFFDVDKGILTSMAATIASGGVLALGAHAAIIASCSAMVACAGVVGGTVQAGGSILLGYVSLKNGKRGSAILCAVPWRVTTNGKDYSYVFHEDGRCYWYEYRDIQIFPDGKGKWRVVKNKNGDFYVEINWESGSKEAWKLPVSLMAQTGTWQTNENRVLNISAKFDQAKTGLIFKTRDL